MKKNKKFFSSEKLIPSEELMTEQYIGHATKDLFVEKGNELFKLCVELGSLTSESKILDVGCGLGRLAKPFTKYISADGEYWGIDVAKHSIDWCKKQYSSKYNNFNFIWHDAYNKSYNPNGKKENLIFRFPFEDSSLDCIFLFSVFTHMLVKDVENYMLEIGRILKPGKKCIITWYLLNEHSEKSIKNGNCRNDMIEEFKYETPECLTARKDEPEYCMAYKEDLVKNLYDRAGLIIEEPIRYGVWNGRKDGFRFQDFVFAKKKN